MVPVHRPALTRWLDLALVVDCSKSMRIWRPQIAELRLMLERLGAFRDIREWWVDADQQGQASVTLRSGPWGSGVAHSPRELMDPRGQRVVLLVSDCVGTAWETGTMDRPLWEWGTAGPVAVLQMLPQRLWASCPPRLRFARLLSPRPAAPNRALQILPGRDDDLTLFGTTFAAAESEGTTHAETPGRDELAVPVLELHPRWLGRWTKLLTDPAGHPDVLATVMVVKPGSRQGRSHPTDWPSGPGPEIDPDTRVERFKDFASTEALEFARYLSAAPLSLPVMRLIRETMLPKSHPSILAEVFLGGMLQPAQPMEADTVDPDSVEYDFADGVRNRLLDGLPQRGRLQVLAQVSD